MIPWEIWMLFLAYSVPMVISPGPGNTLLATAGGRYGVRGSLGFWAGFEVANVALCAIYGLGFGKALHEHPDIHQILKWAGTVYLLYLAWKFFRASAAPATGDEDNVARLGFVDGLISVALNPKIHSMIVVMFSQFLAPEKPLSAQVMQFTIAFLLIGVACHFPWIYGGKLILGRFRSARARRIQGYVFGVCMLLVAVYVLLV